MFHPFWQSLFYLGLVLIMIPAKSAGQLMDTKVTTGVIHHQQGDYTGAIDHLELAVADPTQLKPKNVAKAHAYLVKSYYMHHNQNAGSEVGSNALDQLYEHYQALETAPENEKFLKLVDPNRPSYAIAMHQQGSQLYNEGRYTEALPYFQHAAYFNDQLYNAFLMVGYCHYSLNDYPSAIGMFEKTIELSESVAGASEDPVIEAAYYALASMLLAEGRLDEAIARINKGIDRYPQNENLHRARLSYYLKTTGKEMEAVPYFRTYLNAFGYDINVAASLGSILFKLGDVEDALELMNKNFELEPDHFNSLYQMASFHINESVRYSTLIREETDEKRIQSLEGRIKAHMQLAHPFLLKLAELEPDEPEWQKQLEQAAFYIDN